MVVLLNILPILVLIATFGIAFFSKSKKVKVWAIISAAAFLLLYSMVQPSYLPKGEITRTAVPDFSPSSGEIQDRNRKPEPSETRQARQEQAYRDGFPKN